MNFANIEGVTTAASLEEKNNPKEADLDRQAFLKLFTTQLQNQNPLEPVKNEAFIAQLAQFSTLEATSSMSDSLSNFVADQRARGLMEGASLIGKKVYTDSNVFRHEAGRPVDGSLQISSPAEEVVISVKDASTGALVNQFRLGAQGSGEVPFVWNGGDSNGEKAPSGDYIFTATASRSGRASPVPAFLPKEVVGVSWDHVSKTAYLDLEDGEVLPLERVKKIAS